MPDYIPPFPCLLRRCLFSHLSHRGVDYCCVVLCGLSAQRPNRLKYSIGFSPTPGRGNTSPPHFRSYTSSVLIGFIIQYSKLFLVFKCLHGLSPADSTSLVLPSSPAQTTRFSDSHLLAVPSSQLHTLGHQSCVMRFIFIFFSVLFFHPPKDKHNFYCTRYNLFLYY